MPKDAKVRFIIRAAMTEYMILMFGALLLYLAVQMWPKAVYPISFIGGISLAAACVLNFLLVLRTSSFQPTETRRPPRR